MNKIAIVFFTLSICFLYSCSKDSLTETDDNSIQLIKRINRYKLPNGQIHVESFGYNYDAAGHLISVWDNVKDSVSARFIYDGDSLKYHISYQYGRQDTLPPIVVRDGGNTIAYVYTLPKLGGIFEKEEITFKFSGNQLIEHATFLYQYSASPYAKGVYSYDAAGNHYATTGYTVDGKVDFHYKILEHDNKKNYYSSIPKLNYILGGWGRVYPSRSKSNPTKVEFSPGKIEEYIWTYNNQGYPLTMQVKGTDYVLYEWEYNK